MFDSKIESKANFKNVKRYSHQDCYIRSTREENYYENDFLFHSKNKLNIYVICKKKITCQKLVLRI